MGRWSEGRRGLGGSENSGGGFVLGKGEVNTVPDIVSINVSLRHEAKKASKAMTSLTELSDNLIIALLIFSSGTEHANIN